jgi:2-polyprenyl-3-methyl-5-hydroxy-6-metoxy-1,4-benzoquinol methylase
MSEENRKTLLAYDKTAQIYIDNTIKHDKKNPEHAAEKRRQISRNLRDSFASLPKGAKILEIGSADGDNAKILESLGFDVTASDVAPAFFETCKKQGLKTLKLNLLTDKLPSGLHGVLCWRVFVHFTREDIRLALKRVYNALLPGGRFVFNVIDIATHDCDGQWYDFPGDYKMGAKRFYAYYKKEDILSLIEETSFVLVNAWPEHGGHNDWFCFVLEKPRMR